MTYAANRFPVLLLGVCLVVALPVPAEESDTTEAGRLVAAVNRIAAIRAGEAATDANPDFAVARTACGALTGFVGGPLQRLLSRAYEGLDAHQKQVQALLSTDAGFDRFLERAGKALRANGLDPAIAKGLRGTVKQMYHPGGGMVASYSMNLHASEVSTAVCHVASQLRAGGGAGERARLRIEAAATVLRGLALVSAMNPAQAEHGEPPEPEMAAAATATGSVLVARAYRSMF